MPRRNEAGPRAGKRDSRGAAAADYFDKSWEEYDRWYETHPALYGSELKALRRAVPAGRGLEVGVGTGRFSAPLSVRFGLDPSVSMLRPAKKRGIRVVRGLGENLPFRTGVFSFVLIVFVLEFVDKPSDILEEAARVLKKGGHLVLGIIDAGSRWGEYYRKKSYQGGLFRSLSARETVHMIRRAGLVFEGAFQSLIGSPPDIGRMEEPQKGFGRGGFVVLRAVRPRSAPRQQAPGPRPRIRS